VVTANGSNGSNRAVETVETVETVEVRRLRPLRRSVCVRLVLEGGVRLRVKHLGPCYVRAKNLKWVTRTLKNWRFKTRFFASFLFAFEKK